MTRLQDCLILTGMTLRGCDIANAAVAMLEVVPVYGAPASRFQRSPSSQEAWLEKGKRRYRLWAVLSFARGYCGQNLFQAYVHCIESDGRNASLHE